MHHMSYHDIDMGQQNKQIRENTCIKNIDGKIIIMRVL